MGRIVGDHLGRELLRLHRLEELPWADSPRISVRKTRAELQRNSDPERDELQRNSDPKTLRSTSSRGVAMGRTEGDHIGRKLMRLHRLEELQRAKR